MQRQVVLSNGVAMPLLGFGVFKVPPGTVCEKAVLGALSCGYRLIDTAAAYMNEVSVGRAMVESHVARSDIFLATKVWVQDFGYEKTKQAVNDSMKKLGVEYLDLELLHQSMGDYHGAWRALEELYREGRIRAIGVSNFNPERLADLCLAASIAPMVNQIECHPFWQRHEDLEVAREFGVHIEAWAPFAEGGRGIFTNPVLTEIAARHDKTVAQVALRWNIQRGITVIPKTVQPSRMKENATIWDFELDEADMAAIAALDTGHSEIIDHTDWKTVRMCHGFHIHP